MTRMIECMFLNAKAEGLEQPPYPGKLGEKIFNGISKPAWQQWVAHQTMLMNEHRLTPINPKDRAFLEQEMQKFLFEKNAEKPEGYQPVE